MKEIMLVKNKKKGINFVFSIEEIKKSKESSDQDLEACLNKLHKNTAVTRDMEQQVRLVSISYYLNYTV